MTISNFIQRFYALLGFNFKQLRSYPSQLSNNFPRLARGDSEGDSARFFCSFVSFVCCFYNVSDCCFPLLRAVYLPEIYVSLADSTLLPLFSSKAAAAAGAFYGSEEILQRRQTVRNFWSIRANNSLWKIVKLTYIHT